jgi:hypothetical protein
MLQSVHLGFHTSGLPAFDTRAGAVQPGAVMLPMVKGSSHTWSSGLAQVAVRPTSWAVHPRGMLLSNPCSRRDAGVQTDANDAVSV